MIDRLVKNWVYGGALAGLLIAALTPLLAREWPDWLTAIWLMLPMYLLHQWEEHDNDRFRIFVNSTAGRGSEALSPLAVFMINIPGVWGVIAIAFALAARVRPGLGLIAIYLVLVNALAHVGGLLAMRRYNPGVITAIAFFLPCGCAALWIVQSTAPPFSDHIVGLGIAIAIHAAIVVWVRWRSSVARSWQS